MGAADQFNERAGTGAGPISGIVTTGTIWRFFRLDGTASWVDAVEYPIQMARKIFGALTAIALRPVG